MTIAKTTSTKYMVESGNKVSPWVDVKKKCAIVMVPTGPGFKSGG